ncbi:MAG: PH domain-containing protein [Propioniciclava sp.]
MIHPQPPISPHDDAPGPPNSIGVPAPRGTQNEQRLHPLTPLVRMWVGVLALGWYTGSSLLQGDPMITDLSQLPGRAPWWLYLVGGAILVGLVVNYWSWWTTRYVINDDELRLENTGAFQESQRIAFSRIQSVDVTQPFAARILGLAELSIDVGADSSTKLAFLSRQEATRLRDYLMARAHGRATTTHTEQAVASAWDDLSRADRILIRLSPGEIILGAVASLEFTGLLVALAIPLILTAVLATPLIAVGGGFFTILLALIGFVSTRVFGQFNYTLARTSAGIRITRGLFTLKSQTIPTYRVQSIRLRQPLPWRWFNRGRLDVSVLGMGDDESGMTNTILLPIGRPDQVQTALAAIWPGLRLDALRFTGPPPRARWLDPFAHHWLGYAIDALVVVSRTGWLGRSQHMVPHARLQSVTLHQGPVIRRSQVATVVLHPAGSAGLHYIQHIDAAEARRFVFEEMSRARAARADELLDPPGLRPELPLIGAARPDADLWALPSPVPSPPPLPPAHPGTPDAPEPPGRSR